MNGDIPFSEEQKGALMKAILVHTPGGPEQMKLEEVPIPQPGAGSVVIKLEAIGVNYIDIYFRTGLYPADRPITIGQEGAGVVTAIGEGVTDVAVGDRVAYAMCRGSYAEYAAVPAWQAVKIPSNVSTEQAAAAMLQGMTAHYLSHSTFALGGNHTALVHAAAGGVGRLLVQMAKMRGAQVVATVGSPEKARIAQEMGADIVIDYNATPEFDVEIRKATQGRGVEVVYDSVGAATWERSLNSLRTRGMMVSYGNASGAVPPFQPLVLSQKGSLYLTRPTLAAYTSNREELLQRAGEVLGWIGAGTLKLHVDRIYALGDCGLAHADLASRKTTGKLLLKP
jgi:NADPH2:quinone reductase